MTSTNYAPVVSADLTAAIASGQTGSAAVDLSGCTLCGVYVPSAFTGTALTFQSSPDGVAYSPVKDGTGSAYSKTVAAGDYIPLDASTFAGVRFLKVVSGSAEAAARSLTLAVRPV